MYQRDLRGDSSRNDSQESEKLKKSNKIDWKYLCQNENAIDIFKEEEGKQPNCFDISIGGNIYSCLSSSMKIKPYEIKSTSFVMNY